MHGCGCWSREQAQVTGGEELKHWGGRGAHRHVRNIMVGGNRNPGEGGLESDATIINGCEEMTERAWDDRDKDWDSELVSGQET